MYLRKKTQFYEEIGDLLQSPKRCVAPVPVGQEVEGEIKKTTQMFTAAAKSYSVSLGDLHTGITQK